MWSISLRGLLCRAGIEGEEVLRKRLVAYVRNHRDSGPGYRLAEAPLVWLDVDVIAAATKQAMQLEHEEKEALLILGARLCTRLQRKLSAR